MSLKRLGAAAAAWIVMYAVASLIDRRTFRRNSYTDMKVRAFLEAPVTRREFEQELQRLWAFVGPMFAQASIYERLPATPPTPAFRETQEEVEEYDPYLQAEIRRAIYGLRRRRRARVSPQAQAVAKHVLRLRKRRAELRRYVGTIQLARQLALGVVPTDVESDLFRLASELVDVEREHEEIRKKLGGWGQAGGGSGRSQ